MTDTVENFKIPDEGAGNSVTLPLTNVALALTMMEEACDPDAEAGLRLFYGNSGWGKTFAVTACAIEHDAAYVCAIDGMTPKSFLLELLEALGEGHQKGSVVSLTKYASQVLLRTGRPVIIDETDQIIKKAILNTLRAVHDRSQAAFILVGEEKLAERLSPFEQLDNRIIGWHPAQPCSIEDGKRLAKRFAQKIKIAPDLISAVVAKTEGVTRRVRANFIAMNRVALAAGEDAIDLAWWLDNDGKFITGAKPDRFEGKPNRRKI